MIRKRFEVDGIDEEPGMVGDPDDETVSEVAGVAPPCDACETREADEQVGGADLCGECLDSVDDEVEPLLDYLNWLQPASRGDFLASEIGPRTRADRGRERGVDPSTVSNSVSRAYDRLTDIAEERGSL